MPRKLTTIRSMRFGDAVEETVVDAEIRKAQTCDQRTDSHPQAVLFGAQIVQSKRN